MRLFFYLIINLFFFMLSPSVVAGKTLLYPMQGAPISFESLKGKWVFLNYWASWCGPCLDEIPALNRFYKKNKEKQIALFAVNYDGLSHEEQKKLTRLLKIKYPTLNQDPAIALHLGDISVLPITFVFNPAGELHETLFGGQTVAHLSAYLHQNN